MALAPLLTVLLAVALLFLLAVALPPVPMLLLLLAGGTLASVALDQPLAAAAAGAGFAIVAAAGTVQRRRMQGRLREASRAPAVAIAAIVLAALAAFAAFAAGGAGLGTFAVVGLALLAAGIGSAEARARREQTTAPDETFPQEAPGTGLAPADRDAEDAHDGSHPPAAAPEYAAAGDETDLRDREDQRP